MSKLAGTEFKPEELRTRSPELYASLKQLAPLKVFLRATVHFLKGPAITLQTREAPGPTPEERRKQDASAAVEAARAPARKAEFDERVRKHAEQQQREAEETQRRRNQESATKSKGAGSVAK